MKTTKSYGTLRHWRDKKAQKQCLFCAAKLRASSNAWQWYYTAENSCLIALRNDKHKVFDCDLTKLLNDKPRKFWKVVNPIESCCHSNEFVETTGDLECDNTFNIVFSTYLPTPPARTPSTMPAITIFHDEILSLLYNTNLSSPTSTIIINCKLLKGTRHTITTYLCIFFYHSLFVGHMPNDWKVQ